MDKAMKAIWHGVFMIHDVITGELFAALHEPDMDNGQSDLAWRVHVS
jgi:hypothetical protein